MYLRTNVRSLCISGSSAHFPDVRPPKSEIMKSLSQEQRLELIGVDISADREKTVRLPPVLRATRSQRHRNADHFGELPCNSTSRVGKIWPTSLGLMQILRFVRIAQVLLSYLGIGTKIPFDISIWLRLPLIFAIFCSRLLCVLCT